MSNAYGMSSARINSINHGGGGCPDGGGPAPESTPATPTVCFWLIGNPVSGQGRGASVIDGIAQLLSERIGAARVRSLTSLEFFATFGSDGDGDGDNSMFNKGDGGCRGAGAIRSDGTNGNHYDSPSGMSLASLRSVVDAMNTDKSSSAGASGAGDTAAAALPGALASGRGNVCAFIIRTREAKDGVRVARAVAALNCQSRWGHALLDKNNNRGSNTNRHQQHYSSSSSSSSSPSLLPSSSSEPWLHVVGVVGGDGSLGDVVNGLCWGTLAAYHSTTYNSNDNGKRVGNSEAEARGCAGAAASGGGSGGVGRPPLTAALPDLHHRQQQQQQQPSCVLRGPGVIAARPSRPSLPPLFGSHDDKTNNSNDDERNDIGGNDNHGSACQEVAIPMANITDGSSSSNSSGNGWRRDGCSGGASTSTTTQLVDVVSEAAAAATLSYSPTFTSSQPPSSSSSALAPPPSMLSDSERYYWRLASDRTALRHLLPGVLYTPGGTGADFAKLRLCCNDPREAVDVLCGVMAGYFNSTLSSSLWTSSSSSSSSFFSYEVDVGRVTFPRTGRSSFFINEASIGMSCDVVERGEHFKRSRLMAALGGKLLFASSAAISLVLMAPKLIRVARLPPMPSPPSAMVSAHSPTASPRASPPAVGGGGGDSVDVVVEARPHLVKSRCVAEPKVPLHLRSSAAAWALLVEDERFLRRVRCRQQEQNQRQTGLLADPQPQHQDYYRFFNTTTGSGPPHDHQQQQQQQRQRRVPSPFYAMPAMDALIVIDDDDIAAVSGDIINGTNTSANSSGAVDVAAALLGGGEAGAPVYCDGPAAVRALLDMPIEGGGGSGCGGDGTWASNNPTATTVSSSPSLPGSPPAHPPPLLPSSSSSPARWAYLESSTLAFGNGRWYGGGMHVTPHANPTDGLLSCTNWVATVLPFVSGVFSLYTGGHVGWKSTTALDGERFVVDVGPLSEQESRQHARAAEKQIEKRLSALRSKMSKRSATATQQMGQQQRGEDEGTDEAEVRSLEQARQELHWSGGTRPTMLMEADGDLLGELPAVAEIGGALTLFTPSAGRERQWESSFGPPAPGTARAARAEHRLRQLAATATATATADADADARTVKAPSSGSGSDSGGGGGLFKKGGGVDGVAPLVAIDGTANDNPVSIPIRVDAAAAATAAVSGVVVVVGGSGSGSENDDVGAYRRQLQRGGWLSRGWRGVRRLFGRT